MRTPTHGTIGGRHPAHARSQVGDGETDRFECRGEERVQLEAIPPAPSCNELCLQCREVERHRTPKEGIETLERNCGRLERVDRAKRRQRRLPLTGIEDAREIGVEVEGFSQERGSSSARIAASSLTQVSDAGGSGRRKPLRRGISTKKHTPFRELVETGHLAPVSGINEIFPCLAKQRRVVIIALFRGATGLSSQPAWHFDLPGERSEP